MSYTHVAIEHVDDAEVVDGMEVAGSMEVVDGVEVDDDDERADERADELADEHVERVERVVERDDARARAHAVEAMIDSPEHRKLMQLHEDERLEKIRTNNEVLTSLGLGHGNVLHGTWFKVPQRPIFWHSGGLSTPL